MLSRLVSIGSESESNEFIDISEPTPKSVADGFFFGTMSAASSSVCLVVTGASCSVGAWCDSGTLGALVSSDETRSGGTSEINGSNVLASSKMLGCDV